MTATVIDIHSREKNTLVKKSERFEYAEFENLSDLELMSIVLGGGSSGRKQAENLFESFNDLHGIERAYASELRAVHGLGPMKAASLKAALSLGRRAAGARRKRGIKILSAADIHRFLSPAMRHRDREEFVVVLLDGRHCILRDIRVAQGGLSACYVHPRDVLEPAIRECAVAVIFAHNHPSGDPSPSPEDIALTKRLCKASDLLGIRALDHIVIGDGSYVSLLEKGLMEPAG